MSDEQLPLPGTVLDDAFYFSFSEISQACAIQAETVQALVEEGIIEPAGDDPQSWRFPGSNLYRAQIALRLQNDLNVNLAGAALALDLLDEIRKLREKLMLLQTLHSVE